MAVRDGGLLLLTGAAGRVAARLRAPLRARYRLRLTDVRDLPGESGGDAEPVRPGEVFVRGDLTDPALARRLTEGVDAVVHLAGAAAPDASWDALLHSNLAASAALFDAAADRGVPKLVYASSVHAAGGWTDPRSWPVDPAWPPRPCCRYGVSKVGVEAMARLYADQVPHASVVVLRLALVTWPPRWRHEVRGWLADDDLVRLVHAALDTDVHHAVQFGVSRSAHPRYRLDPTGADLGYRPGESARPDALPDTPPRYAGNCRLWRIPTEALDASAS